jgi:hypothetical protein
MERRIGSFVHVVNRTTVPLEVMHDGAVWPIRPGYKVEAGEVVGAGPGGTVAQEPLPYFAAERAKRQNPVMGTGDRYNPNSFESLIALPKEDYSHVEQSDAIEGLDRATMDDDAQAAVVLAIGGGRRPVVPGRVDKAPRGLGRTPDTVLQTDNPTGIRLS